ncbi:hypothetical protein CDD82_2679 [Ophiocordyceps australis]|uniref:Up-regulated in Daf-2 domain-containing protein n=1 Tax=Ophiocordyceps australis TaxID=1399860 RepID=A0A2C5Y5V2_9HYPO|nr:hypothetical protein CDD82_2679 [Ophiocordyceps australis]
MNQMICAWLMLIPLFHTGEAVQQNNGCIRIRNEGHQPIVDVNVIHKYESEHSDKHTWGKVYPGVITKGEAGVTYNTGLGTTGSDWWFITWTSTDEKVYITSPSNAAILKDQYRGALVHFEDMSHILEIAINNILRIQDLPTFEDAVADIETGSLIAIAMFNDQSTVGFKQHMLTDEDIEQCTTVVIKEDNSIVLQSLSGSSSTITTATDKELIDAVFAHRYQNTIPSADTTNCTRFTKVKPSEGCDDVARRAGVHPDFFKYINSLDTECGNLCAGCWACVALKREAMDASITYTPHGTLLPTIPRNLTCNKFIEMQDDEGCDETALRAGIHPQKFREMNFPDERDCKRSWPNLWACVSTI